MVATNPLVESSASVSHGANRICRMRSHEIREVVGSDGPMPRFKAFLSNRANHCFRKAVIAHHIAAQMRAIQRRVSARLLHPNLHAPARQFHERMSTESLIRLSVLGRLTVRDSTEIPKAVFHRSASRPGSSFPRRLPVGLTCQWLPVPK